MRTCNFSDVLAGAAALMRVPEGSIGAQDFLLLRGYADMRLQEAWEVADWPELVLAERRWFRDWWSSATTYAAGAEVFFASSGKYYQSLLAGNVNHAPATLSGTTWTENSGYWAESATGYTASDWVTATAYLVGDKVFYAPTQRYYQCYTAHTSSATLVPDATAGNARWGVLTPFDRYVSYTQTGQTAIGECLAAWDCDPRVRHPRPVSKVLSTDGVQVLEDRVSVWLEIRTRRPILRGDTLDSTKGYAVGAQVYFKDATTGLGNFYDCISTASAGQTPTTHASKWSVVQLPYVFLNWLRKAIFADWKGGADDLQLAYGALELEADKLMRQQGENHRISYQR